MAKTGMGEAHLLHLRLFMEGIEVPIIGASVTSTVNQPASATIQIVPSDRLTTLLPRTTVHVFFLDTGEFARSGKSKPDDHHYKLMFCGEVFDITFGKSGHGSRNVSLRCLDFSNVWDTNYSYIMRYAVGAQEDPQGGAIRNLSGMLGAGGTNDSLTNSNPFDDIVNDPAMVIRQMASASGAGNPALPGKGSLLGGLLSILELLSGIQGLYMGINPWATIEERRVRVLDSIVSDNGTTARNLFDQQVFADWVQQKSGTFGSVISFRQIVGLICQYIYYDVVPNVTPAYDAGNDGQGRPGRLAPKYNVTVAEATSDTEEANTVGAQLVSDLPALQACPQAKINGLDSAWWGYCVQLIRKIDELAQDKTYLYGDAAGEPITFVLTSGFRNLAQTNAIRATLGKGPVTQEYAAKNAHMKGFAIDLCPVYSGRIGNGNMPYRTTSSNPAGKPVPMTEPNSNKVVRFRKAIWWIHENGTSSPGSFDGLVAEIENNPFLLSAIWGDAASPDPLSEVSALQKDVDSIKNDAIFWDIYRQGVAAVNAESDITGTYGGDWRSPEDPLWSYFGHGHDPVHVQDLAFKTKEASGAGDPPAEVVALLGEGESRERLKSYIFRPNIWFSPPPLCNVVFPHMYETMSVTRQMMMETTRLQLSAYNQFFESAIVNHYYYAPKFPAEADGSVNHVMGEGLGSVTKTIVMDHEVFSGIIPKLEQINEISFYAKAEGGTASLRSDEATESRWESSDVTGSAGAATISSYGDKVAHFNLLTHRYSSRSGSFSGPFNPYLVCGFPAVVVNEIPATMGIFDLHAVSVGDRPFTEYQNVHWLGMITQLSHTYDQGGARTSAQLSYVRSHRIGDETDDLLSESVTDQGMFVIQDPKYTPSAAGDSLSVNFSTATLSMSADDAAGFTSFSDSWLWKLLSTTIGQPKLSDLVTYSRAVFVSANPLFDPYIDYPTLNDAVDDYEGIEATNTADFSGLTDILVGSGGGFLGSGGTSGSNPFNAILGETGQEMDAAQWKGNATWAMLRFKAETPSYDISTFTGFPSQTSVTGRRGGLSELTIMPLVAAVESASLKSSIETLKNIAAICHVSQGDAPGEPMLITMIDVPVLLPGAELSAVFKEGLAAGGTDRAIPVEEAIRPPWMDRDVYTAKASSVEGFSNLCLLYKELFHSPSIIHNLLQIGATPYDGMDVHSVEQAVDYLVTNSALMATSTARDSYVAGTCHRPIASLPDVLAPKGYLPQLLETGSYFWKKSSTISGVEGLQVSGGFHSNAVTGLRFATDYESITTTPEDLKFGSRLEFLDLAGTSLGSRLQPDASVAIDEEAAIRADPRAPRAYRVKQYADDIGGSSALRQVGFGSGVKFRKTPLGIGKKG